MRIWLPEIMSKILLPIQPKRGELYMANFEGAGSVQQGMRPGLIVQNDFINTTAIKTTIVCPLTSRLRHLSTHVLLKPTPENGLDILSEVVTEQVAVINKSQFLCKIGNVSSSEMQRVDHALPLALDIDPDFP